jgi:hypothetical protein
MQSNWSSHTLPVEMKIRMIILENCSEVSTKAKSMDTIGLYGNSIPNQVCLMFIKMFIEQYSK